MSTFSSRGALLTLLAFTLFPSPLFAITVLFLGGADTPSAGADGEVMTYLEGRYGVGNVVYGDADLSTPGDEAAFDVLVISSTVSSGSVRGKFHDSSVPILNWESVITDNSQPGELKVTTRLNEGETDHGVRILRAHPITAGFAVGEVVQLVSGAESLFWSVAPESSDVTHLAEDDDTPERKFLSILDQGETLMGGGMAPGRRVIFGLKDSTFSSLTVEGRALFGQALDWAAAGAVAAVAPTVVNSSPSEVESSSAVIGGEVVDTGGVPPAVTLFWGDEDGGTTAANWDERIEFGPRSAAFSAAISGLVPGSSYYFRSFAENSGGSDWADSAATFVTGAAPSLPSVVNGTAANITFDTADVHGTVTSTGGETPDVTIYFGTSDGGMVADAWEESVSVGAQSGSFENTLFFLESGTVYFFRAFAENSGGGSWAPDTASFTTESIQAPAISMRSVSDVTGTSARVDGSVDATGGEAPEVILYWGQSDGGTNVQQWENSLALGARSADFTATLTGLTPSRGYFARAYAENRAGGTWSDTTAQFTTTDVSALIINEFMAANDGGATNNPNDWWPIANQVPGTTDDWIEIHNSGTNTLSLAGWHLTDDPNDLQQWTFPLGTTLGAGEYLLIFASGDNSPDANGNLHTSFALDAEGEYVALVRPGGQVASEFGPGGADFPAQDDDVSYGAHPVTGEAVYFDAPTPGAPNDAGGIARVADTKFSPDRGYYASAVEVTISTATQGAAIYYTTDGSPPIFDTGRPTSSAVEYTGPIMVDRTTPLRAAAALPGLEPSNIDTHTYFLFDIDGAGDDGRDPAGLNLPFLRQRQPSGWGNLSSGDYLMDTNVSLSNDLSRGHDGLSVSRALLHGLRDIPTVSIAMDRDDFAGRNGIYTNSTSRGFAWERPCSAEFIPAAGDPRSDWGERCGLRVQGGASRNPDRSPKHSLSFRFRAEYGAGKLRENLFPDGPVSEFNVIALRAVYNNSWIHSNASQREVGSLIRDQWARETMLDMGHEDAGRGFMVHLFINGLYWGVHNLCERQDASHYAAYHGGDEDQLDARNGSQFVDGDSGAWNEMRSIVSSRSWARIQQVLDIDNYIDYQIVNRFGANADLKTNGNWRAAGGGPFPGGDPLEMAPWRIYSWDAERILESPSASSDPLDPVGVRDSLDRIPEYRMRFADRLQKHFFNGGALTPEATKARWMKYAASLDRAVIAESARWGDHRRGTAYTRGNEWLAEQRRLCDSYFPVRTANVLNRYRSQGFYPDLDAPQFLVAGRPQHGGEIPSGQSLDIRAGTGSIYYTVDGSDPRLEGGAVNPAAIELGSNEEVALPASGLVRARVKNGSEWSALVEAEFYLEQLARPEDLALTELNYHPRPSTVSEQIAAANLPTPRSLEDPDLFEFVEIQNISDEPLNLDGVALIEAVAFQFENTVLDPGAFVVVVKDSEAFAIRYPDVPVAGVFSGNLDNDGERVALVVQGGDTVHDFTYDDAGDWPMRPDGIGSSLEVIDLAGAYGDTTNWRASAEVHGSPGAPGIGAVPTVVVNEVRTHTALPTVDAIELHNLTNETVDLTGWGLSDSSEHFYSFAFPDASTVAPGGYLVLDESDFNVVRSNPVSSFSGTVAAAPTVVNAPGHGLATGDVVTISGYSGIGAYTGTFEVTALDDDSFAIPVAFLDDASPRGTWSPGRPFALNSSRGDEVWLVSAEGDGHSATFIDQVSFDGAFEGETLGRWPDGGGDDYLVTMTSPTLGDPNAGPRIGPVVISEVMYQPSGGEDHLEFVEICNTGSVTEPLAEWRLRGGADFDFRAAHQLAPGAVLVVVSFDPDAESATANLFRSAYGIGGEVELVGPFSDGPLRDDRGSLRLQRPDLPPPDDPGFHPSVTEDLVNYRSTTPWPAEAGGNGASLTRTGLASFGNFAASWSADGPTPGGKTTVGTTDYAMWSERFFGAGEPAGSGPLEDFDLDGFLNLLEFGLGFDPTVFNLATDVPAPEVIGGDLTLTFVKDTSLSGIVLRAEASMNLRDWFPLPDVLVVKNGSLETRRASVETAGVDKLFVRLAVEAQP